MAPTSPWSLRFRTLRRGTFGRSSPPDVPSSSERPAGTTSFRPFERKLCRAGARCSTPRTSPSASTSSSRSWKSLLGCSVARRVSRRRSSRRIMRQSSTRRRGRRRRFGRQRRPHGRARAARFRSRVFGRDPSPARTSSSSMRRSSRSTSSTSRAIGACSPRGRSSRRRG